MRVSKKENSNDKGFTLIEVVITIVILALVTAPFLSSFVTASKTNMKSKRVQEANELSQYVIEEFKATSINNLVNEKYKNKLTVSAQAIDTSGTKFRKVANNTYSGTLQASDITTKGFSNGYTVDLKLTPSKVKVNQDEAIPVIEKLERKNCLVMSKNLTNFDTAQTQRRKITIKIEEKTDAASGTVKYPVTATIELFDTTAVSGTPSTRKELKWTYEQLPSIYLLYLPKNVTDEVYIDNEVVYNNLPDNTQKVNVYIINQSLTQYPISMSMNNIYMKETTSNGYHDLKYLYSDTYDPTASGNNIIYNFTVMHTNVYDLDTQSGLDESNTTDKNDSLNRTVKTIKWDTAYNLDVQVNYDGKKVATYHANKLISN